MTKTRTVWLVKEDAQPPESVKPSVFIETTAAGKVTYGVRVSGRSLKAAREQAQQAFAELKLFVEGEPMKLFTIDLKAPPITTDNRP